MAQATLIYLHGFLSSGGSAKANQLAVYLAAERPDIHYLRPTLPDTPREAWAAVCDCIKARLAHGPVALIGSSLGGFWATCAAEQFSLSAVVVNPAVHPQLLLEHFLGEQTNPYTGQRFTLVADHMQALAAKLGLAQPTRGRRTTFAQSKTAASPRERKVWALWHQLHRDGVVRDASARSLRGFVERQTGGVSDLRFCNAVQLDAVIEALKDWQRRGASGVHA